MTLHASEHPLASTTQNASQTRVADAAAARAQNPQTQSTAAKGQSRGRIAYLAGAYPLRSETFVFREVAALRERGWFVQAVGLRQPPEPASQFLPGEPDAMAVYDGSATDRAKLIASECLKHPLRSLGTLVAAVFDAAAPGEPLTLKGRLKLLYQAGAALSLAHRLRKVNVSAIHCHFAHAPATVGMYAAEQLGIPFSFTGHANDLFQRRALLKRKLQRASFVACISQWHRGLYQSILTRDDAAYPIIRCGVDVDGWAPTQAGDPASITTVLTVCRLVPKKGIDTLVQAISELNRDHPARWRLVVAGDGPERKALEQLVSQAGSAENIQWEGAVDSERVRELMQSADIFALPCRTDDAGDRDGIPVVLMEAMACGLPVVAGDLDSIRELVIAGKTGLLVPGDDATAVAQALQSLSDQPALRQQLAGAGREHVAKEFSKDVNVQRIEDALRRAGVKNQA